MLNRKLLYSKRLDRLIQRINEKQINLIAINASQSLSYFTGLHFHLSERPAVLLVSKEKEPVLIFPEFESEKVKNSLISLVQFPYPENRSLWIDSFKKAFQYLNKPNACIGVEPTAMRFLETDLLQAASHKISFASAAKIFEDLREIKDASEIQHIKKAIQIAQEALLKTLPFIKPGVTEREIANELVVNLLRAGSEPDLPFTPIVASGPNSTNPHSVPCQREVQTGEFVIIDFGARSSGYVSDITRTFAIGKPDDVMTRIYETVKNANQNARSIEKEPLLSKNIDQGARQVITDSGYGKYFTHRTGHGIGLEAHEAPFISANNPKIIRPGMTFTIEPGIYIDGKAGVRIEDNILATENGLETLTSLSRELIIL
ncbi:MAG: aminopeptidase P family protein [Anaerolineaceae bacterium]|nr:aminopeptidase P family protein [Anaerolineaceae bacterium]